MTKTLFTNIGSLILPATEIGVLETLSNAAFVVEDGLVAWVGDAASHPVATRLWILREPA